MVPTVRSSSAGGRRTAGDRNRRAGAAHLVVFPGQQVLDGGELATEPLHQLQPLAQAFGGQRGAGLADLDQRRQHPVQRRGQLAVLVDVIPPSEKSSAESEKVPRRSPGSNRAEVDKP